jgi:hypothetical protein
LITNARTAASLFMTGDERAARLLAAEKEAFRSIESTATDAHFERLRSGRLDSAETNIHLVAAAAYPVLANSGSCCRPVSAPTFECRVLGATRRSSRLHMMTAHYHT